MHRIPMQKRHSFALLLVAANSVNYLVNPPVTGMEMLFHIMVALVGDN